MKDIFVYGTLKKGFRNHHFLDGATFLTDATLTNGWKMLHLGGFPGMVKSDDPMDEVEGEVYRVSDDMIPALDRLEGVPTLYQRIPVEYYMDDVGTGHAEAYLFQPTRPIERYDTFDGPSWR